MEIAQESGLIAPVGLQLYESELDNEPLALKKATTFLDLEPTRVAAFQDMEQLLVKQQVEAVGGFRAMLGRAQS